MTLNIQFRNSVTHYDGTDAPDYHPSSVSLWSIVGYSVSVSNGNGGNHLLHDCVFSSKNISKHFSSRPRIWQTFSETPINLDHVSLPAVTKLGQGNVFTGVCDSVHRGESASPGADTPWEQTPPEQTPPRADTPLQSRHPPWEQTPPRPDTPPDQTPHRKQTPAYGQPATGTHPTGMHSC